MSECSVRSVLLWPWKMGCRLSTYRCWDLWSPSWLQQAEPLILSNFRKSNTFRMTQRYKRALGHLPLHPLVRYLGSAVVQCIRPERLQTGAELQSIARFILRSGVNITPASLCKPHPLGQCGPRCWRCYQTVWTYL